MSNEVRGPRKVKYIAPDFATISEFSGQVCELLAKEKSDPAFSELAVKSSFANFMMVVGEIVAKNLSVETESTQVDRKKGILETEG